MRDLPDKLDRLEVFQRDGLITPRYALERAAALGEEFEREESRADLEAEVAYATQRAERARHDERNRVLRIVGDVAEAFSLKPEHSAGYVATNGLDVAAMLADFAYRICDTARRVNAPPIEDALTPDARWHDPQRAVDDGGEL